MEGVDFADGIYHLMEAVSYKLGGGYDPSSGIDYRNEVFESRNFWMHSECGCHVESAEWDLEEAIDARLSQEGVTEPSVAWDHPDMKAYWKRRYEARDDLAPNYNLTHTCEIDEPQFRHFASGLEVRWYKRVGRSTESNMSVKALDWYKMLVECIESVRDDARETFE